MALTLAVAAYLALNAATQILVSPTANFDQAEVLLLSQDFRLGYTAQPPLYIWLTATLETLFGPSLWLNLAFKAALLAGAAGVALRTLQDAGGTRSQASVLLAAYACIPTLIWESQRALTHSSLALLCVSALVWQVARLRSSPTLTRYLTVGILAGLSLLTKYNTVLALASLLLAMGLLPGWRRLLLTPPAVLTVLVAMATVAPHVAWLLENTAAIQPTLEKLESVSTPLSGSQGLRQLLRSVADFTGPLALIVAIASLTSRQAPLGAEAEVAPAPVHTQSDRPRAEAVIGPTCATPGADLRALLSVQLAAGCIVLLLAVIVTGTRHFEERWLLPVFVTLPLWVALRVRRPRTRHWLVNSGLFVAVLVSVLLPGRVVLGERLQRQRPALISVPYQELARQLRQAHGVPAAILADSQALAGNLRLAFPHAVLLVPGTYQHSLPRTGPIWVVYEEYGCSDSPLAERAGLIGLKTLPCEQFEAALLHHAQRRFRLYFQVLRP